MGELKLCTLISGLEEGWSWSIVAKIFKNGTFKAKGYITKHSNKEEYQRYGREHILKNRNHYNKLSREWKQKNPKKNAIVVKKWRDKNPEKTKKWNRKNIKKIKESRKKWAENNSEKVKLSKLKTNARRKRNLGFIPLNIKFKNSVAHHINREEVVFIPESIHRGFQHNLNKPSVNLDIVNSIAYAEVFYAI